MTDTGSTAGSEDDGVRWPARLAAILEFVDEAIISVDVTGRIQLFNRGAERIFGWSRAELLGQTIDVLIPERLREQHRSLIEGFARSLSQPRLMHHEGRPRVVGQRRDGREFPAEASISRLEEDGAVLLTVVLRDISDRVRVEEAAEQALRARDEVLGIVAHDLRSPLHHIFLESQVLRGAVGDVDAAARMATSIDAIAQAVRRMNRLIQDLLDVVALEAGALALPRGPVSPRQAIADAVEAQRLAAQARSIELRVAAGDALPEVAADHTRLLQILENLINNALKFTPAGGRITVGGTYEEGSGVRFRVSDTGAGIAASDRPHVFERFWQAHPDRRGSGIGLAIVKALVEGYGGKVEVESTAGQGTTVSFTMPVVSGR